MNPRIYKKQAKRAVELLRSHGGWPDVPDVDKVDRWSHPQASGSIGIDGCPVFWRSCYTDCGTEWDTYCPRNEWIDCHYWGFVTEEHLRNGDESYPRLTLAQFRERFKRNQIAPGWRWRGGRAVRVT